MSRPFGRASREARGWACALALVICAGAAGCDRNPVVLRVGERQIRLDRFESDLRRVAEQDTTLRAPDGVRVFLDDYVNKNVLELMAREAYPMLTLEQMDRQRKTERDLLRDEVRRREITSKIEVGEQEARDFHQRRRHRYVARHIMLRSRPEAEEVLREARGGGDFGALAVSRSVDSLTAGSGGLLPRFVAGMFFPEFEDRVMAMTPGEIGLVESPVGFHVVRLDSVVARADTTSFEAERDRIEDLLRARKIRGLRAGLLARLFDRYDARIDTAAVAWFDAKALAAVPGSIRPLPPLDETEKARVLATFQGDAATRRLASDTLTAAGYVECLRERSPGQIPRGGDARLQLESLKDCLYGILCAVEGKRLGIDREADVAEILHDREERLRVTRLYTERVEQAVTADESDYRAFYDAHREDFREGESWLVQMIGVRDSALAQRAAEQWRGGVAFRPLSAQILAEDSLAVSSPEQGIALYDSPDVGPWVDAVRGRAEGEIGGPVVKDGLAYIVRLRSHTPERVRTYEEAFESVRLGAEAEKKEERLQVLLAEGKKRFPVMVNEKALAKVKPPAASGRPS